MGSPEALAMCLVEKQLHQQLPGAMREYVLHPLGLIMRGSVFYLVATARDYDEPRLYALHRFIQVTMLNEKINVPKGFHLDIALEAGMAGFAVQDDPIQLELRCSGGVEFFYAKPDYLRIRISSRLVRGCAKNPLLALAMAVFLFMEGAVLLLHPVPTPWGAGVFQ